MFKALYGFILLSANDAGTFTYVKMDWEYIQASDLGLQVPWQ